MSFCTSFQCLHSISVRNLTIFSRSVILNLRTRRVRDEEILQNRIKYHFMLENMHASMNVDLTSADG